MKTTLLIAAALVIELGILFPALADDTVRLGVVTPSSSDDASFSQ